MNKLIIPLVYLIATLINNDTGLPNKYITSQGQVTFFSYTSVENIEAKNNQVLSVIDFSNNEIAISMLMNAFVFKKALMQEHFNESYIESDLYPKATFEGTIVDFDATNTSVQTKMIKGKLTIREITKEIEIKVKIEHIENTYILSGDFELTVKDFEIKIPSILAPNISKTIAVQFQFKYQPYDS
ncbi:hypothetical protein A8C32_18095 [Flavivirga aquatica]|uniref:Lipid/polyisoprenoid-binding YceI-like domain-containing protein n=2 Tax=Flavivirga aquatica TaxID=1849968 RepID=A0A1E5T7N3_9FLAO|nr:YceI family protein [Flavivirga aquatica]OEK07348.1 hypothetical protein A8C32_18095 [Flavivirga aquatica]